MEFALRPINIETDIDAIAAIYGDAVANGFASFEIEPPSAPDMQARAEQLLAHGYPYLIAEAPIDGEAQVVGFAYLGPHKPRRGYRFTWETSIYLHPFAHCKGVGSALLNGLILACQGKDVRQLVAVIGDSNNVGSILVHAKHGFEEVGIMKQVGRKHGRWLDVVFMQRAVNEGGTTAPNEEA